MQPLGLQTYTNSYYMARLDGQNKRDKVACQENLVCHDMRACVNGATTETHRAPFFKVTRKHSYQASTVLKGTVKFSLPTP